jgi:hypothetical protein
MMVFRKIRDGVRSTLAQLANGEFEVVGHQARGKGASEVDNKNRLVEVFYNRGDFPKSAAGLYGPTKHDITFRLDLTVSAKAQVDLSKINDPSSTPAEIARAIADGKAADQQADDSMDELFDRVYQILMDARNDQFGLPAGTVASRWASGITKDEPNNDGNRTIITGTMQLTCTTSEPVEGVTGVEIAAPVMDTELEIETDSAGKSGVQVGA